MRVGGLGAASLLTASSLAAPASLDASLRPIGETTEMDTEIIAHPRLQHYGLITPNLDPMVDWYRKVLGMTINHRSELPAIARGHAPFDGFAFITMDSLHHRLVLFHVPAAAGSDGHPRTGLQHVAFNYKTIDELLGTYVRLKNLGIAPIWAADHGVSISLYYRDPDHNRIELNFDNYEDEYMGTEFMKASGNRAARPSEFDPDKLVAARNAGASAWNLHERIYANEFPPSHPTNPSSAFGS